MDLSSAADNIEMCREEDQRAREQSVSGHAVVLKYIRARRIWDLWSNRVVPTWMVSTIPDARHGACLGRDHGFFAVSHAWVADNDRQLVDTAINSHPWPVPIPSDTTLERVRTKLLHHTSLEAQYAWLDVLCLRQEGREEDETVRKREWKSDIPTIGAIYRAAKSVVYYYSGLGRPFRIKNLRSKQHWLKRAWCHKSCHVTQVNPTVRRQQHRVQVIIREKPVGELMTKE